MSDVFSYEKYEKNRNLRKFLQIVRTMTLHGKKINSKIVLTGLYESLEYNSDVRINMETILMCFFILGGEFCFAGFFLE